MQPEERLDPELLTEQLGYVQALARRLVLDEHAADDLVQETLLAALKNPPRRSMRGFLARVLRNLAYKSLRTEERRMRRERRAARSVKVPAPDELLAKATAARRLIETLVSLEEPYRTALLLRYFEDLQPKQIAAKLQLNAATVRSHLKRGLEKMRERLDAEHGGDRRAWCLALLPLAFASAPASAAATATAVGVTVMTVKKWYVMAASLLVALFGTLYVGRSSLRDDAPEMAHAAIARSSEEPVSQPSPAAPVEKPRAAGVTLEVVVRNLAGEPLEGADVLIRRVAPGYPMGVPIANEIRVRRWIEQSRPLTSVVARATTDRDGRAELRNIPGGRWDLLARREGHASRSLSWGPAPSRLPKPLEILLGPARGLAGRVVDEEGKPVPGAIVLAGTALQAQYHGGGPWPARTVADDNGRYEFSALPEEDLSLWAAYPASVARFVALLRTPGPKHFDIMLRSGGVVEGSVTAAGESVAGALVVVSDLTEPGSAVTDQEGHYRIEHMPEVYINKIDVSKKGLAQVFQVLRRRNLQVSRHDPVRIDVEMVPGASIRGRVLGPDGPIPGASAGCTSNRADSGGLFHRSVVADEQGRFLLADLPPGRQLLRGSAQNHTQPDVPLTGWNLLTKASEKRPFIVELKPGEEIERDIQLVRVPVTVEGWVEGPDGKPFEGARVGGGGGFTASGPDGRFLLPMKPQALANTVGIYADGYVQAGPKPVIAGDTTGLHLRLRRAPTLVGTVRNEAGQTVQGAYVRYARGTFARNPDFAKKAHLDRLWYLARRRPVDRKGSFEIEVLGTFDLYLRAQAPGYAPSTPVQLGVKETTTHHEIALVLRTAHRLRGNVTCGGMPVAGAQIRLRGPTWVKPRIGQDYSPASAVVAVTDSAGSFETEVGAGSWTVAASAVGCTEGSVSVRVPGEQARLELEQKLSIEGRLVFADGKPAVGAAIYRWQIDAKGMTLPNQGAQSAHPTDAQGRFVLADLDPGLYRLSIASLAGANVVRKKVEPIRAGTKGLRIVAERGLEITGRLVDENGNGLSYVSVNVRGLEDPSIYSFDQTDLQGYFKVRGLPDGLYRIKFTRQDQARSEFIRRRIPAGAKDLVVAWGQEDELDAADRERAIGGVVVDAAGRAVPRAFVVAKTGARAVRAGGGDSTDAKGRFLIERLKPGRYKIEVSHGYTSDLGSLSTGTLDARLVIPRGATIQGIVRDEKGRAIQRAEVRVSVKSGTRRGKTGPDGAFTVKGLPAEGRFDLIVSAPEYAITVRKGVRAGATGVVLVVRPGLAASGRLEDSAGTLLARTTLYLEHTTDPHFSVSAQTDEGARFRVEHLNPGRYDALAFMHNKYWSCGTIDAGATGIVLVISGEGR